MLLGLGAAWLLAVAGARLAKRRAPGPGRNWRWLPASLAGVAHVVVVLRDALQDY